MADIGSGFLQAVSAFCATRLGKAAGGTFKDTKTLVTSLGDGVPDNTKPAYRKLKQDVEQDVDLVKPLVKAVEAHLKTIAKMASESIADAGIEPFTLDTASRIGVRVGQAILAMDAAVHALATELAKDEHGTVDPALRDRLMGIWNPWVQPFRDLADGAGKLLDALGSQVLGVDGLTSKLAEQAKDHELAFDAGKFRISLVVAGVGKRSFGVLTLEETKLEVFLGFGRTEFVNPGEEDKKSLTERDGKWWRADEPVFGVRVYATIQPGITKDPLLSKIMPGSAEPKTIKPTAVSLDSRDGLYLGDGRGAGNEKAVLPVAFATPVVEIREVALGIVRNPAKEATGLEVTTVVAGKIGDVVGVLVSGAGVSIALDGEPSPQAMFPWDVSPRWPDAVGVRVKAGPVKGGGYLERKLRSYGDPPQQIAEFGGVLQLEILKVGVYAIGILAPEPFSFVLVMGVRFPTPIELSFGFTLNGVGGLLAVNRTVDTAELLSGMKTHLIDRLLFPDDPVAEAPGLLDKVAKTFPPAPGGFVVGPIVELGWGSQAKIVEAKLGLILALPDPKVIILGAVRVRAPSKVTPLTDFRCEVYGEISADRFVLVATLRDSKIAGITVSGDLGLLIQWGGGGDFALSVGGFNPRYQAIPPDFKGLERLTIDLSPPAVVKIIIKAYLAVTAGAVMAGVRGDLSADIGVASAKAWLQLDMIFFWVPRFGFAVDLDLGISIKVFGMSFAELSFKGSLEGTTPWKVEGTATVDVWFLPTFHFDLGPFSWGDGAPAIADAVDPLAEVTQALSAPEAWKAVLPADGDQLAVLARVDATGLVAHPLACLEVSQSKVPLETPIDRIGSARTTSHRVALGLPRTSAGDVGAVSSVAAPFAPGQFLDLTGEQLLARSGFDDLPSGCRIAAATTPQPGAAVSADVRWHTYYRDEPDPSTDDSLHLDLYAEVLVGHGLPARELAQRENPYLPRVQKVTGGAAVSVAPAGAATVHRVDDAGRVLADLGVLTASQAAWASAAVTASGAGELTSIAIGAL